MTTADQPQHQWPEDEPTAVRPAPKKLGRWARFGRAIGDSALTIGMSQGMTGDNGMGSSTDPLLTNSALFSEGQKKGQEANRGSDGD